MKSLEEIATYIVSDGKGILAADESTPTIGKRFATINAESTEDSRGIIVRCFFELME